MFYFQTMFQQVYNGITGSPVIPAVQQISEAILLLAALFAVYEAYAKGGDARTLALAGIRYLFMGLLITQYPNVFINVANAVANLAQAIAPTDVWTNFRDQVQGYMSANNGQGAWWNWVVGGVAGAFSLIFQAIAVLVFPISYALFSFFYSMYGAVLYVVGPLVLALYPALGVGQLARTFMVNLMVWNAWGIIYAIISQLLTIMSANSLNNIFNAQSFGGAFQGASQMLLISLSSILLSIMILLIPFIAKRVVSGDIGSTMLTVVGVAAAAAQAAVAGWVGMQGGAASAAGGGEPPPPPPPPGGPPTSPAETVAAIGAGGGGGAAGGGASQGSVEGAAAPRAPSEPNGESGSAATQSAPATRSTGSRGHSGRTNIPYSVGWTVGTWAGATRRTVRNAFRSNEQQVEEGEI
ncbi:MAG TPA: hypothetical protein VME43_03530 [Bryobacteraceae bacterium]|nr:hypothetical protein [Bryobacteraceae bacterium]